VKQCAESDELPPHELRYYTHLVILISKLEAVELDRRDFDKVLHRYVDLLIRMHLCAVVPFYLFQLTDKRVAKNKMIDFLECKYFHCFFCVLN
jgi:hypothetical protein